MELLNLMFEILRTKKKNVFLHRPHTKMPL